MKLNKFGTIAFDEWTKTPQLRPNVELGEFVIMPNHIHGIVHLLGRGELHSPDVPDSPNSVDGKNIGRGELYSPDVSDSRNIVDGENIGRGELHSPENKMPDLQSHHPTHNVNNKGESNSHQQDNMGECNAHQPTHNVDNLGECNSHQQNNKGECNAHHTTHNVDNKGECNSHQQNNNKGECNSHQQNNNKGECNSPLRGPSQTIGAIVRGYKSSVTKQLGLMGFDEKLWQRNYHEHIIRNEQSYQTIANYIMNNPAKWHEDKFFTL